MPHRKPSFPVWDLPTRLFHWLFVLGFVTSWLTHEFDATQWHFYSGYGLLVLLLFRIIWGCVGSRHARFADFWPSLSSIRRYLQDGYSPTPGHNPLGALSVLAMLGVMGFQIATGLANADDAGNHAPYNAWALSAGLEDAIGEVHEWVFGALVALVGLHVSAVIYYTVFKKQRIIPAMLDGYKDQIGIDARPRAIWLAIACLLLAAGLSWLIVAVWAPEAPTQMYF